MRVLTGAVLLLAGNVLVAAYVCVPRVDGSSPQYLSCIGFVGIEGCICQLAGLLVILNGWRKDLGQSDPSNAGSSVDLLGRLKDRKKPTVDPNEFHFSR